MTVAPVSRASAAIPPAWSKCGSVLRIYLMSRGRKPSRATLARIAGAA
jgi:hypothetical protein